MRRVLLVGVPLTWVWVALIAWHGTVSIRETWQVTAMFAGLTGLTFGIAGVAARRSSRGLGGAAAAPTVFVLIVLSTVVPPRWRPLPLGDIPGGWTQVCLRWSVAALIGALVFLSSSRDRPAAPWQRRLRW
jgi:hypothetical protein